MASFFLFLCGFITHTVTIRKRRGGDLEFTGGNEMRLEYTLCGKIGLVVKAIIIRTPQENGIELEIWEKVI